MLNRPAAFLDRDGVINEERNYVHRIEDFNFLPGALNACRQFAEAGYLLVIVTNQAGIARGYYNIADFKILTDWMSARFYDAGAPLSGIYYCPHHPNAKIECNCRKPKPGLILQAQRELGIDLKRSFLVGDKASDIEAGRAAGVGRCFLISNKKFDPDGYAADSIFSSLANVAELIRGDPNDAGEHDW